MIFSNLIYGTAVDIGKMQTINTDPSPGNSQYYEFNIPSIFQKQNLFSSSISTTYDQADGPSLIFNLLLCNGSMPNAFLSVKPQPNENQFDVQVRETTKGVRQITILSVSSNVLYLAIVSNGPSTVNLQLGNAIQNSNGTLLQWSDANATTSIFKQVPSNGVNLDLTKLSVSFYVTTDMVDPVMSSCYIQNTYEKHNTTYYTSNPLSLVIINGLQKSSQYLGFILINRNGVFDVFTPIAFYTLENEDCTLVYGGAYRLNTCTTLARNVPNPSNGTVQSLLTTWESYAAAFFNNFTQILNAFDCANTKYSMVRNCNDCSLAYLDWTCRQIIPRCVASNVPPPPTLFNSPFWISSKETQFQQQQNAFEIAPANITPPALTLNPYNRALSCISYCLTTVQSCPTFFVDQAPYKLLNCPDRTDLNSFGYSSC